MSLPKHGTGTRRALSGILWQNSKQRGTSEIRPDRESDNKRFGINEEENAVLYVKSLASLVALGFIGLIVLYLTGLNVVLQR
jgi:hypothetical protein